MLAHQNKILLPSLDIMGLSCSFMHLVFWLSLFHLTLADHVTSSKQSLCHDDERSSLLQFKESLIINNSASGDSSAYPKIASWKAEEEDGDCCSWDGITCHKVTGHVIKLDLTSSYLYGSINSSSSLFHLVHLEWLSLADNDFNGAKVPSGIMKLSSLSYLDLSFSAFSGQIPSEILKLSKLETLDVSHNRNLELRKPDLRGLVEKLTNLKILHLSQVNISASVPHILANLTSLTYLSLRECQLQSEFPAQIFHLPNLSSLSVRYNPDLTGYLPDFETSSPLEDLRLAGTRFSGEIPDSIGNLNSLSYLDISDCNFSGAIPSSLGNLTKISYFYMSENNFVGELPSLIGNHSSLEELDLSQNTLSGRNTRSLSWMAKLNKLTYLGLSEINLFGEIPSWLTNLTQLSHLYMSHNKLTGSLPNWLMNLTQLVGLSLSSNRLTGHIPSQIRKLAQLRILALGSNQLQGPIPGPLSHLQDLEFLDLGSNNLSGRVDLNLFLYKLKNLDSLILSSNSLSLLTKTNVHTNFQKFIILDLRSCNLTEFPNFLRNQDQIQMLDLSSNKIAGPIPGWLVNLSINPLLFLNLSYNLLTGFEQHPVFLPWTRISYLDLRSNELHGELPVPPPSTEFYLVSYNNLTGKISPLICNSSRLQALDLSYNSLSGELPQCLGNFSYLLSTLNLQSNKFHGTIPQTFMNGTKIRMIDLSNNRLQGKIPRSLANCTELEFLDLGNNQIHDTFPFWLETLPKLKVLILQSNKLSGEIKPSDTDHGFPELRIIDLSHNRFSGNLPSRYFESWHAMKVVNASALTYMQDKRSGVFSTGHNEEIDLFPSIYDYSLQMSSKGIELEYGKISNLLTAVIFSSNKFAGEIPASIGNLRGLHFLILSNNDLVGCIPSSLGNLRELESLDLSNNRLSGAIPQKLAELTFLAFFNVSNNHLTGSIPQGKQFETFETNSFDGNPGLCGKPLSKECENAGVSQKQDPQHPQSLFEFDWKTVLIGYASGLLIGLVLGNIFAKRRHESFAKFFESNIKEAGRNRGCRNSM